MKHAEDYVPGYGEVMNTWTFYDGTKNYFGNFHVNPVLDTTLQANNTYTLEMTGMETTAGQVLTMAISLSDLGFTNRYYQSGVGGSNQSTAFYYTGSSASRDAIYSSTNVDPGAVMNYTITAYDAATKTATISFSGEVFNTNGKLIPITRGKIRATIDLK
jgi:hypothetical protein